MSDASVITDVSETLRSILDAHFNLIGPSVTGEPAGIGAPVTVTVDNPQRSAGEDLRVNLYLYHILQDESRRNTGPLHLPPPSDIDPDRAVSVVPEPLALKLYYMVTAFAPEGRTEHRLIGEAIQAFHMHRVLDASILKGGLATSTIKADQIQLVMLNQDLETLHRIWGNFQEALRPSATFEVEGIYLDALAKPTVIYRRPREIDLAAVPFLSHVAPSEARPGATIRLYGANLDLRSPVDDNVSLVRILFNGTSVAPLAEGRTNRAVSIIVPPAAIGQAHLQVQIGEYKSRTVPFEVLPP
jgi:hypothetical protein